MQNVFKIKPLENWKTKKKLTSRVRNRLENEVEPFFKPLVNKELQKMK